MLMESQFLRLCFFFIFILALKSNLCKYIPRNITEYVHMSTYACMYVYEGVRMQIRQRWCECVCVVLTIVLTRK